ncbi:VRR-NUC domain-containing protein [Pseudomonas paeninsulae]|uniref:VRR-NUC domain-containing protein n=1 Tax=Pseudomonas paeninsulae TaxID=3110772 RepID=UPI002D79DD52|nr:VRR-NUC domain-containing protein [Pseudomonas sp. IT1137]
MQTVFGFPMQPQLDPSLYYLCNFHKALAWLRERHHDLLLAEEQAFLRRFGELALPSQALLVRMIMRKGPHFRASKLAYAEIGCPRHAAQALLDAGWIRHDAELALAELFELLRKEELLEAFAARAHKALKKPQLLAQLTAEHSRSRSFADWCPRLDEQVYSLAINPLCERLRLLFFGNLQQDWSAFVLADLGIFRYEPVALSADSRVFTQRAEVDCYLALQRCHERGEAGEPVAEVLQQIAALDCATPFLAMRRAKLRFRLGQHLERAGELENALACYVDCPFTGARLRRIRVLEGLGRAADAHALASQAAVAAENEAEAQGLERVLLRLRRQLGLPQPRKPKPPAPARLDLCLPKPAGHSVEYGVKLHLSEADAPVHYVENSLICSLFGLLCWPAIFAPLPGAFFHPFQSGPLDLLSPDFQPRRAELFATCLAQLDSDAYKSTIRQTYADKYGIQSPFVFWNALDQQLLEQALDCLPAAHLRAWFQRLLADIKANRAGMPDLIQFWPAQRRYRMIEVKGPGDRLQDNQRRWLAFCAEHGMPVDVCYVQWADA